MKVIILCGGMGTRLREETEFRPKPMVFIGNKPMLWHIMKIYAHYGFNEFILALGYRADYIKRFFLDQKAYTSDFILDTKTCKRRFFLQSRNNVDDFKITFVDTGLETLVGERVLRCRRYVPDADRNFMVTYGDGVVDVNIKKLLDFHKKQKTLGTILGIHSRSKFGVLKVDKNNLIKMFSEKPVTNNWVNGGFMVFKKEAFNYFKLGISEHPVLKSLAKEDQLSVYKHESFWFAMDTNKEMVTLNNLWLLDKPPWKIWK